MIRVSQILFWFGMTMAASLVLYHTSDRVHVLDQQLRQLNAKIEDEQKSLHVLKAEWVYLANPTRLENTAHKFLALRPTVPHQVVRLTELADMLIARNDAVASNVSVSASPIASPTTSLKILAALRPHIAANKNLHARTDTIALASADTGHINDRMIMPVANPAADGIGNLITTLGTHP